MTLSPRYTGRARRAWAGLSLLCAGLVACATANDRQQRRDADVDSAVPQAVCGNGQVETGEACDDGNLLPGDGCSSTCTLEQCDAQTCFHGCCNATGDCVDGVSDDVCGQGGVACTNCQAAGSLCFEQACLAVGDCTPGDEMSCGYCGTRQCDASGAWGACEDEGICVPGEIGVTGSCGNCGALQRTCQSDCTWGTATCESEGICAPSTVETGSACGSCGREERTCTAACDWGAWTCEGEGTCPGSPGQDCCTDTCVDLDSDPDHCGNCATTCGTQESCCGGGCVDTSADDAHCGNCTTACGSGEQCCASHCTAYDCIDGGACPGAELQNDWPADPACTGGRFTVGVITERHWGYYRKYAICVDNATSGTITRCTGDVGVCTAAACPSGTVEIGLYVDYSSQASTEQQRICVGEAVSGTFTTCVGPIGNSNCTPAACASGAVDLGVIKEHNELTSETTNFRLCVVPQCPPSCP